MLKWILWSVPLCSSLWLPYSCIYEDRWNRGWDSCLLVFQPIFTFLLLGPGADTGKPWQARTLSTGLILQVREGLPLDSWAAMPTFSTGPIFPSNAKRQSCQKQTLSSWIHLLSVSCTRKSLVPVSGTSLSSCLAIGEDMGAKKGGCGSLRSEASDFPA